MNKTTYEYVGIKRMNKTKLQGTNFTFFMNIYKFAW